MAKKEKEVTGYQAVCKKCKFSGPVHRIDKNESNIHIAAAAAITDLEIHFEQNHTKSELPQLRKKGFTVQDVTD